VCKSRLLTGLFTFFYIAPETTVRPRHFVKWNNPLMILIAGVYGVPGPITTGLAGSGSKPTVRFIRNQDNPEEFDLLKKYYTSLLRKYSMIIDKYKFYQFKLLTFD